MLALPAEQRVSLGDATSQLELAPERDQKSFQDFWSDGLLRPG